MMKKVSKMMAIALGVICSLGILAVPTASNAAEIQRPTATGVRFDANGDGRVSVLDLIRAWKEYSYTRAENPEQAPSGFVYCTTDMLTSGKDTVQLSDIKNLRSKFIFNPTIASVQDMITALPEAETLISKNRVAVGEAKAAYDALSDSDKASVVNAGKLNACVAKVKIWDELASKVVLDASYQVLGYANDSDNGKEAVLLTNVDDNTFEKVYSIKDVTYVAVTKDLKTAKASFRESENIVLYIYNPTDSVVDGNYTMNWGYYGYFQLKPNAWNRIEIADFASDDVNKQMINSDATLYFYANMAGEGWKISSFYDLSDNAADVAGETVAVDAAYQTLGVGNESGNGKTAIFTPGVDDADFGKVMSVKDATFIAITNSVKGELAAFRESDAIAFYIYNPTDSAVNGRFTMDWNSEFYFQLKPNAWNRIFFADFAGNDVNKQMISSDATLYFYADMLGEGWKVSSFYGLSLPGDNLDAEVVDPEAEAIAAVIAQITALPEPNVLKLSDKEAVVTAESAFNTLSEAGKEKVDNATKLTECLAKIADLEDTMSQAVAPVEALINALPDPSTIVMPDNMKELAAIDEAKKAYDALTSEQQGYVNSSAVSKLNGCLTATQGYAIVFNAETETALMYPHTGDQDCTGTVSAGSDVEAGAVFKLDITAKAASGAYGGGFYVYKEGSFTGVKNIVFMIYNPTGGNVNVEFYGDNWAKGFGTTALTPEWNRVELLANAEINNGLYARIPMDQNAVGEWLISSIYSVTDEALAAEKITFVTGLFQNMPSADEIVSLDDTASIQKVHSAREAYDALGADQFKIDATLVDKLLAAEAKITSLENGNEQVAAVESMLEALTPADQITALDSTIVQAVEDARAAYDALGDSQSQVYADLVQKLVDCEAKIALLKSESGEVREVMLDASSAGQIYVYNQDPNVETGATVTVGTDTEHGNVFIVNHETGADCTKVSFEPMNFDMTGYDKVEFSVYNPASSTIKVRVQEKGGDWAIRDTVDAATGWTKITVDCSKYTTMGILFYIDGAVGNEYKVSQLVGVKVVEPTEPSETRDVMLDASSAGQIYVYNQDSNVQTGATVTVGTDAEYGNVFLVNHEAGADCTKVSFQPVSGFDMTGYDKVEFSVYNPASSTIKVRVQENGGSWAILDIVDAATGWTKITVDCSKYTTTGILFYIDGTVGNEYKVSQFVGVNVVKPTEPSETREVMLDATSAGQIYVYNQDASVTTGATVTIGTDSEYGNVFLVNHEAGADCTKVSFEPMNFDMTGYDKVEFSVYNPASSTIKVRVQEKGGNWAIRDTVDAATGWTKITVDCSKYTTTGILFYIDGAVGNEYKVSPFVGVK